MQHLRREQLGNGIGFSYGESHSGTSYNENLTVETDDQMLFLRPMGFGMGGERDSKLSEEGRCRVLLVYADFSHAVARAGRSQ